MLISTKPDSKGKAAALARAAQLTEFKWTPIRDIPIYTKDKGKHTFPAGEEVKGMIYSSPEPTDKFIGENISVETFLSVLANPDSVLYTKDLGGHNNSWASFGLVCNGLARYALGIRRRFSTKRWPTVPGMRKIADEDSYGFDQMELCDILYAHGNGRSHVAMITDLLRDESGKIVQVEVSEAIRPSCVRRQFDMEAFREKFNLFALWRYDYIDSVPECDDEISRMLDKEGHPTKLPDVAVDLGTKSNYLTGEDVTVSVFREGTAEITKNGEVIESITGKAKITRKFDRGYYTVTHLETGYCVEFCVNEPKISYKVENNVITVTANSNDPESRILYMDFREKISKPTSGKYYNPLAAALAKVEELTEDEKSSGVITRVVPEDAGYFKVYFENKYGVWTQRMIKI